MLFFFCFWFSRKVNSGLFFSLLLSLSPCLSISPFHFFHPIIYFSNECVEVLLLFFGCCSSCPRPMHSVFMRYELNTTATNSKKKTKRNSFTYVFDGVNFYSTEKRIQKHYNIAKHDTPKEKHLRTPLQPMNFLGRAKCTWSAKQWSYVLHIEC